MKGTYRIHIQGEDWGCGTDQIIVSLAEKITSIRKDDLKVKETKQVTDWSKKNTPVKVMDVERQILDAYLCDEDGKRVEEASSYFALELYISPEEGSPFLYTVSTGYNTWSDPYDISIQLQKGKTLTTDQGKIIKRLNIDKHYTSRKTSADVFIQDQATYQGITYNYAYYQPHVQTEKLFVWLNGAGEGGSAVLGNQTNVEVTLLANKVTALAGETFQNALGGCQILVPQAPTMWMDDGKGNVLAGPRKSIYLESLIELIDDYVKKNDIKTVLIGGCSNGGYMTMNIAMDYGKKYQGYVAICEAMLDDYITDEDINVLKDVPLYLVFSKDDTTVPPHLYEIPTIERLRKASAKDLHVSIMKHVIDTSGRYYDQDGHPYLYNGHWSWIYFDNNETSDEDGLSAFEWLSRL